MGAVIGDLLPLAVGVAISPIPIIAVILMLLAPRAVGTSTGFLLGWVVGIVAATTLFTIIAATAGVDSSSEPAAWVGWVKIVLGAVLLLLAFRQWQQRPRPGQEAHLPKWMAAIDSFTFVQAAGLGFLLSAINPENLIMCVGAGAVIGQASISLGQQVIAVAVFTVIAACSVAIPVIAYLVAKQKMRRPLDELKTWLESNNATVMAVLLLVIGAVLIGKGLTGI